MDASRDKIDTSRENLISFEIYGITDEWNRDNPLLVSIKVKNVNPIELDRNLGTESQTMKIGLKVGKLFARGFIVHDKQNYHSDVIVFRNRATRVGGKFTNVINHLGLSISLQGCTGGEVFKTHSRPRND